jgi:hypothetical protein
MSDTYIGTFTMAGFLIKTNPLWHLNFSKTEDIYMNRDSGDSQLAKEVPNFNGLQILWPSSSHQVFFCNAIIFMFHLSSCNCI